MTSAVYENVWREAQCPATTLLVLLALADAAADSGDVDAAVKLVAEKARTTQRNVRRLVETIDRMQGVSARLVGGQIQGCLTRYRRVLDAERAAPPTSADNPSMSADEMSTTDELSAESGRIVRADGRIVRDGQIVLAPSARPAPPTRVVSSPPSGKTKTKDQDHPSGAKAPSGPAPAARKRASKPKPGPGYGDLFVAVCRICVLDPKSLTPQDRGVVDTVTRSLDRIKATVDELEAGEERWYADDWRGKKGQEPTPSQLATMVTKGRAAPRTARTRKEEPQWLTN